MPTPYPSRQALEHFQKTRGLLGDPYRDFDTALAEMTKRSPNVPRETLIRQFEEAFGGKTPNRTVADMPEGEVMFRSAGDTARAAAVGAVLRMGRGDSLEALNEVPIRTLARTAAESVSVQTGQPQNPNAYRTTPAALGAEMTAHALSGPLREYQRYKKSLRDQVENKGAFSANPGAAQELEALENLEWGAGGAMKFLDWSSRAIMVGLSKIDSDHALPWSATTTDPKIALPYGQMLDAATYALPDWLVDAKLGPTAEDVAPLLTKPASELTPGEQAKLNGYLALSWVGADPAAGGYPVKTAAHALGFIFGDVFGAAGAGRRAFQLTTAVARNPKLFATAWKIPRQLRDIEMLSKRVSWVKSDMRTVDEITPEAMTMLQRTYGPKAIEMARDLGPRLLEESGKDADVANGLLALSMAEFANAWTRRPAFGKEDVSFLVDAASMGGAAKKAGKEAAANVADEAAARALAAQARWAQYAATAQGKHRTAIGPAMQKVMALAGDGPDAALALEFVARELMAPPRRAKNIFKAAEDAAKTAKAGTQAEPPGAGPAQPGATAPEQPQATPTPDPSGTAAPGATTAGPSPVSPTDEFAQWTQTPEGQAAMQRAAERARARFMPLPDPATRVQRYGKGLTSDDELFHAALELQEREGLEFPAAMLRAHAMRDLLPTYGTAPFSQQPMGAPRAAAPPEAPSSGPGPVRSYGTRTPDDDLARQAREFMETEGLDYPEAIAKAAARRDLLPAYQEPTAQPAAAAAEASSAPEVPTPTASTDIVVPEPPPEVPVEPIRRRLDVGGEIQTHELTPEQETAAKAALREYNEQITAGQEIAKGGDRPRANLIQKTAREKLWAKNREIIGMAKPEAPAAPKAPAAAAPKVDTPAEWGPGWEPAQPGVLDRSKFDVKFTSTGMFVRPKEQPGFQSVEEVQRARSDVQQQREQALAPIADQTVQEPPFRITEVPPIERQAIASRFLPDPFDRFLSPSHTVVFGSNRLYQFRLGNSALYLDEHGIAYVNEGGKFRSAPFREAIGGINSELVSRGMIPVDVADPMIAAKRENILQKNEAGAAPTPSTAGSPSSGGAGAGAAPPPSAPATPKGPERPLVAVLDEMEGRVAPSDIDVPTTDERIKPDAIRSVFRRLREFDGTDHERLAKLDEWIKHRAAIKAVKKLDDGFVESAAEVARLIRNAYYPLPDPKVALKVEPIAKRREIMGLPPIANGEAQIPSGATKVAEWRALDDPTVASYVKNRDNPDKRTQQGALAEGIGRNRAARRARGESAAQGNAPQQDVLTLRQKTLDPAVFGHADIKTLGFVRNDNTDPVTGARTGPWKVLFVQHADGTYHVRPTWATLEEMGVYTVDRERLVFQRWRDPKADSAATIAEAERVLDATEETLQSIAPTPVQRELAPDLSAEAYAKTYPEAGLEQHRELVADAIDQGKILGHPDYRSLHPTATADPVSGPLFELPPTVLNHAGRRVSTEGLPAAAGGLEGYWRGMTDNAYYDRLAGREVRKGLRAGQQVGPDDGPGAVLQVAKASGLKSAPGYLVREAEDGSLLEAWRWDNKKAEWHGVDLRRAVYDDKISRGVAVDPKTVAEYPDLVAKIERAASIRQVKAMVDRGSRAPVLEAADPTALELLKSGQAWKITETQLRSLDAAGGTPPPRPGAPPRGAIVGAETIISPYNAPTIRGRYMVVDRDQIRTSHGLDGAPDPNYPMPIQPRTRADGTKHADPNTRARNNEQAMKRWQPAFIVSDSPGPQHGPSIVYPWLDGKFIVLGGNQRMLMQDMVFNDGRYGSVLAELAKKLNTFGLPESDWPKIIQMRQPMLVRVVDEPIPSWGAMIELGPVLNRDAQDAISAAQTAVIDARALRPLFESAYIPKGMLFADALRLPENQPHVMRAYESMDQDARRTFFDLEYDDAGNIRTGELTATGLDRLGRAVLNNMLSSPELAEAAGSNTNLVNGLVSSFPAIQQINRGLANGAVSALYDFQDDIEAAIELMQWGKAHQHPSLYFQQFDAFGDSSVRIAQGLDDAVSIRRAIMAEMILDRANAPSQMRDLWDQFAAQVPDPNNPQVDMFGNVAQAGDPIAIVSKMLDAEGRRAADGVKTYLGLDMRDLIARYRQDLYLDQISGPHLGELTRTARNDMAGKASGAGGPAMISPGERQAILNHEATLDASEGNQLNPYHHKSTAGEVYSSTPAMREHYDENIASSERTLESGGEVSPEARWMPTPADLAAESAGAASRHHIDRASVDLHLTVDGQIARDALDQRPEALKHLEAQVDAHRASLEGEGPDRTSPGPGADDYRAATNQPRDYADGNPDDIDLHANGFSFKMLDAIPSYGLFLHRPTMWMFTSKVGKKLYREVTQGHARALDFSGALGHAVAKELEVPAQLRFLGRKHPFRAQIQEGSPESQWISMYLDLRPRLFTDSAKRLERAERRAADLTGEVDRLIKKVEARKLAMDSYKQPDDKTKWIDARAELENAKDLLKQAVQDEAKATAHWKWLTERKAEYEKLSGRFADADLADLKRRADRIDIAVDISRHLDNRTRGYTGQFTIDPEFPLSYKLRRVVSKPSLDREGRLIVPADALATYKDGDLSTPFMFPIGDTPGYRHDIVSTMRGYVPLSGRKIFLEPALRKWAPTNRDAKFTAEETRVARTSLGSARAVADVVPEENPQLFLDGALTLPMQEYAYLGEWMRHIQGATPDSEKMIDLVNLSKAKALEQQAAGAGLNAAERKTLRFLAGQLREATGEKGARMALVRRLEQAFMRGMLAFRASTVIKNAFQNMSTIAETHPLSVMVGGAMWFSDMLAGARNPIQTWQHGGPLARASNVNRQLDAFLAENPEYLLAAAKSFGIAPEAIKANAAKALVGKMGELVDTFGFAGLRGQEAFNRGWALHVGIAEGLRTRGLGSIREAMDKGVFEELVREGVELSNRHHFVYGVMGRGPALHSNPVLRTGSMLTQYWQNEWELIGQWMGAAGREDRNIGAFMHMIALTGHVTAIAARSDMDVTEWAGLWALNPLNGPFKKEYPFVRSAPFEMLGGLIQAGAGAATGDQALRAQGETMFIRNGLLPTVIIWDDVVRLAEDQAAKKRGFYTDKRGLMSRPYDERWQGAVERFAGVRTRESADLRRLGTTARTARGNKAAAFSPEEKRKTLELALAAYNREHQEKQGLTKEEIRDARIELNAWRKTVEADGVTPEQFDRHVREGLKHYGMPEAVWMALEGDPFDKDGRVKKQFKEATSWLLRSGNPEWEKMGRQIESQLSRKSRAGAGSTQ